MNNKFKVIRRLLPYILILIFAGVLFFLIHHFHSINWYRRSIHYNYAFISCLVALCTIVILIWVTCLYRKLKKKLDKLLDEKDERMFLLRYQANPSAFQRVASGEEETQSQEQLQE